MKSDVGYLDVNFFRLKLQKLFNRLGHIVQNFSKTLKDTSQSGEVR